MDKKKLYKYIICITNFIVKTKRAKKSRTKYAEWPNISGWRRCSQYFSLFMNADHLNKPYIYTCSLYVVQKTCSILYYVLCSDIAVYVVAYVSVAFIPVAAVYCPTLSLSLFLTLSHALYVFFYILSSSLSRTIGCILPKNSFLLRIGILVNMRFYFFSCLRLKKE